MITDKHIKELIKDSEKPESFASIPSDKYYLFVRLLERPENLDKLKQMMLTASLIYDRSDYYGHRLATARKLVEYGLTTSKGTRTQLGKQVLECFKKYGGRY